MATIDSGTQRDRRYATAESGRAAVEFNYPNPDGPATRVPLEDISVAGISFRSDRELPLIVRGATLDGLSVHVEGCELQGKLLIKHVTRRAAEDYVYGGVFYPDTEQELIKLNAILSAIGAWS